MRRIPVLAIFAAGLLGANVVSAQAARTAYFTVISEKGKPHSAVLLEYPDKQVWLGFKPLFPNVARGDGQLDESDRTKAVDKYVRFEVNAKKLAEVEAAVRKSFKGTEYQVGVRDCVNLSVAFAEGLGLKVPGKPNFLPGNLVERLAELNVGQKPETGDSKGGLPWKK